MKTENPAMKDDTNMAENNEMEILFLYNIKLIEFCHHMQFNF